MPGQPLLLRTNVAARSCPAATGATAAGFLTAAPSAVEYIVSGAREMRYGADILGSQNEPVTLRFSSAANVVNIRSARKRAA
jgi:hypothetical protein